MALPQHRNEKKYRHRKYNPMVGRHTLKLVDKPVETERPFNLDDPPPSFEEWLDEIPSFEDTLLVDSNGGDGDDHDDYGEDYDDSDMDFEEI